MGDQGGQGGAARLAQQQGGLGIDVHKHDFDRGAVGLVALHHFADAVEQHFQAQRQRLVHHLVGADGAAGHVAQLRAVGIQHAKTGGLQARVDAQNTRHG